MKTEYTLVRVDAPVRSWHNYLAVELAQSWEARQVRNAVGLALRDDCQACDGHSVRVQRRNRRGSTVLDWGLRITCFIGRGVVGGEWKADLRPTDREAAEKEAEAGLRALAETAAGVYLAGSERRR